MKRFLLRKRFNIVELVVIAILSGALYIEGLGYLNYGNEEES